MFHDCIGDIAKDNKNFREVLCTGKKSQLVVMCLKTGEDIGEEVHENIDQIFFIVDGDGEAVVGGETIGIEENDVVFVPAGTNHNIKNVGSGDLKLYTVYSPPAHPDGAKYLTKAEAMNEFTY